MQKIGPFFRQAEREARSALDNNLGGPFGAVVVRSGVIVGKGKNRVTSSNDPTAHAEIEAIRNACAGLNSFSLEGSVLYSTCEPCPMCLGAIYWSRIEAVYYASTRVDAANAGFDDSFIYSEIAKPIPDRRLNMIYLPDAKVKSLFSLWKEKENKTLY